MGHPLPCVRQALQPLQDQETHILTHFTHINKCPQPPNDFVTKYDEKKP